MKMSIVGKLIFCGALAAASLPSAALASPDCPRDSLPLEVLRIGLFAPDLPLLVGQARGIFAQHGLSVQFIGAASSQQQFQQLRDGVVDTIFTSPDDVAHYRLDSHNAQGSTLDVTMVLAGTYGLDLTLVTRPEIATVEGLRGKVLGVDDPESGYANVLYRILRNHGLERNRDYFIAPVGQTAVRLGALLNRKIDGTLLFAGLEKVAEAQGFHLLDGVASVADPYLASVFAAKTDWLASHAGSTTAFVSAYLQATRFAKDPQNRDQAIGILQSAPGATLPISQFSYELQLSKSQGLVPDGRILPSMMVQILKLRQEFEGFETPTNIYELASPASGLYDWSYLHASYHCTVNGG